MEGSYVSGDLGNLVVPPGQFSAPPILGDTSIEVVEEPVAIDMGRNLTEFSRDSRLIITGQDQGPPETRYRCKGNDSQTRKRWEEKKTGAAAHCSNPYCDMKKAYRTSGSRSGIPSVIKCSGCTREKEHSASHCPCKPRAIRKKRGPRGLSKSRAKSPTKSRTKSRAKSHSNTEKAGMKHKKHKRSKRKRR